MQSVKVRRTGISADQAVEVIQRGLGAGYRVEPAGDEVLIKKGLAKAKVGILREDGGTVFNVEGQGTWLVIPLSWAISKQINEKGIAGRVAEVISQAQELSTLAS